MVGYDSFTMQRERVRARICNMDRFSGRYVRYVDYHEVEKKIACATGSEPGKRNNYIIVIK